MNHLVYLSGPPGAGKSTLMEALTGRCDKALCGQAAGGGRMLFQRLIHPRTGDALGAELGKTHARFPGTDTLAMNIAPVARAWISTVPYPLVLGEGDRLAIRSFFEAAVDAGYQVDLVYVDADQATLDARCEQRGSKQNRSWRAGRTTKAANLAKHFEGGPDVNVVTCKSTWGTPDQLAHALTLSLPWLGVLP